MKTISKIIYTLYIISILFIIYIFMFESLYSFDDSMYMLLWYVILLTLIGIFCIIYIWLKYRSFIKLLLELISIILLTYLMMWIIVYLNTLIYLDKINIQIYFIMLFIILKIVHRINFKFNIDLNYSKMNKYIDKKLIEVSKYSETNNDIDYKDSDIK